MYYTIEENEWIPNGGLAGWKGVYNWSLAFRKGVVFNTVYYNQFNRIKLEYGPVVPIK